MAILAKVRYWALNYYYMSVGREMPENRHLPVPDTIVNSDYVNYWEKPMESLASRLGAPMSDQFTMDVQSTLRDSKLSCTVHILSDILPYVSEGADLKEALNAAVSAFKKDFERCIAIMPGGKAFSTYCYDDDRLVGNYPEGCIFVQRSELLKTRGDIVGELLSLDLNVCNYAQATALANLCNGGILDGVQLPEYEVCGKEVLLTEYLNNLDTIRLVQNMPGVYEDKWKAALEHLQATGQNPEMLGYISYKCGIVQADPMSKYDELHADLADMLSNTGLSVEEFLDRDATYVLNVEEATEEILAPYDDDVTVKQIRDYIANGGDTPTPVTIQEQVRTLLEQGYQLSWIVPQEYLPKQETIDERAIAVNYVDNCKTISEEAKALIVQSLTGNATDILELNQKAEEVDPRKLLIEEIEKEATFFPEVKQAIIARLKGEVTEPLEFPAQTPEKEEEVSTDDYFYLAGYEILKGAREAVWADQSVGNRLKWSPCVHVFLRLLQGVEQNKKAIKEHLSEVAEAAENPATKDLITSVVNKYFQ